MLRRSQVRNMEDNPLTHHDFHDVLNNQSASVRGGRYDRVLITEPRTGEIVNDLVMPEDGSVSEIRTAYGNISTYTDPRIPEGTILIMDRSDFDTWLTKMEEAEDLAKFKIVNIGGAS
jgi:hypothetical protein